MDEKTLNIITHILFVHQLKWKMFHFQTKNYGYHKASDKYLKKYTLNLDRLLEVLQGKYGRISTKEINLKFDVVSDTNHDKPLNNFINFLNDMNTMVKDPDVLAIRDEMLADVKQFKYLLSFK